MLPVASPPSTNIFLAACVGAFDGTDSKFGANGTVAVYVLLPNVKLGVVVFVVLATGSHVYVGP